MAWTTPPRFLHGDYPTAANLNILSTDIVDLYDRIGDPSRGLAIADATATGDSWQFLGTDEWYFHRYRWLLYRGSSATIEDPNAVESTVSLPDVTSGVGVYDLSQVSWIFPGRRYRVADALWSYEGLIVY